MHKLLLDLPALLETERLILRPYQAGDGPAYFEVCQRNKEHLIPFESDNPATKVNTVEDAEILVRQFAADWVARVAFFFGAWEKATGAFAAQIYVGVVDWEMSEFELGYFVDKDHQGQGYVTEAAKAAIKFIFDCLKACRVSLRCSDANERSSKVAERCGFTREGHLRQTCKVVVNPDGTHGGDYIYGLLREEYEQLYTS